MQQSPMTIKNFTSPVIEKGLTVVSIFMSPIAIVQVTGDLQ